MSLSILVSYRGATRIRGWETGNLIACAFEKLGHNVDRYGTVYETGEKFQIITSLQIGVSDTVFDKKYDLYLQMECNDPLPQYPELKYINAAKHAYWCFDISYDPKRYFDLIREISPDHVFCANPIFVDLLNIREDGKEFSSYLPYAAAPQHFLPLETPKTIDVGLVGSARPERLTLISALRAEGINAQLISNVFKDQYIDALASCKIQINQNPWPLGKGLLNCRFWETQAAGSILIEQEKDWLINKPYLDFDVLTYSNIDNLIFGIDNILNNGYAEIDTYRDRAQDNIFKRHMYTNRAYTILSTLNLNREI